MTCQHHVIMIIKLLQKAIYRILGDRDLQVQKLTGVFIQLWKKERSETEKINY